MEAEGVADPCRFVTGAIQIQSERSELRDGPCLASCHLFAHETVSRALDRVPEQVSTEEPEKEPILLQR